MEFGTQTRAPVEDPNSQTRIDPPALRVSPRDTVTQRKAESTGYEEAFESLGKNLGGALQKYMTDKQTLAKEKEMQETVARQGLNVAVNAEDEKLKRTGWGLQLYGQNPRYDIAQQIAVTNRIDQDAMALEHQIDDYAELHPEEFKATVLNKHLERINSGYDNDPEMRTKLTNQWLKRVPNIVRSQYKAWYGNSQKAIFDNTKARILTQADYWNMQLNTALSEGDADILSSTFKEATDFLSGTEKGDMSDAAWKRAKLEAMGVSLSEGNKSLYELMKQTGDLESLSQSEASKVKTAVNGYDIKFRQDVDSMWADFETELLYTDNLEDGINTITSFLEELGAAKSRATGTEHSELTINRGERNAARAMKRMRRDFENQLKDVAKRGAKAEEEQKLIDSFNKPLLDRASHHGLHTEAEVEKAFDTHIKQYVEKLGVDTTDETTIGAQIIRDPQIAEAVGKKLINEPTKSRLISSMIKSYSGGWMNMFGEDGKVNEDGAMMLQSVNRLRSMGALDRYLSTSEMQDLEFVTSRIESGIPAIAIEKDFAAWKQRRSDVVSGVGKDKGQTQYEADLEYVGRMAESIFKQPIGTQDRVKLRDLYREGLSIYNNDHERATQYTRSRIVNDAAIVNGQMVPNADKVKFFPVNTTDRHGKQHSENISLESVINSNSNYLIPYLAKSKGQSAEDYMESVKGTNMSDQNLDIYTEEGEDGIFVAFPDSVTAVQIPTHVLQKAAEYEYKQKEIRLEVNSTVQLESINKDLDEMLGSLQLTGYQGN